MSELVSNPVFGILISLLSFEVGCFIYKKTKLAIFNPLFISQAIIILFLLTFKISFEDYNKGGILISFFLGPATVVLAVPLYKMVNHLKANIFPILTGITLGSAVGMISIVMLSKLFGLRTEISKSLIPKSVTVPIGVEVSKQLGGIPSITVIAIIVTGILGAIIGPFICKLFKVKDKIAVGIALGTASHALGTTRALELGEIEGAMSGLSIGVAGIITVFLSPIIANLFQKFM